MKKNIVKLNEGQLRKIVAESVKKVISEIDWKTYANAADKRRKQARSGDVYDSDKWKKAQELDKAASRALSDKYGRTLHTWGDNWNGETGDRFIMDDEPWTNGTNAIGPEPTGYWYRSSKDRDWRDIDKQYQEGDYRYYGDIPYDSETDNELDKQNNEIGREIDNYTHDRYAYDDKNGWHLKEAVDKAVKSVLKESIKEVDPNNVVSKEVAEKFGFRPDYTGFDDGLELWSKHLNFNPLEDYQQASKLLSQLGIKRFTTENWKGNVRITVRNNVNTKKSNIDNKEYSSNNSYYKGPKDSKSFGKPWTP